MGVLIYSKETMRFIVLDDEGILLRKFYSKAEAQAFLLPGYSLRVLPKPKPRPLHWAYHQALADVGEAPF